MIFWENVKKLCKVRKISYHKLLVAVGIKARNAREGLLPTTAQQQKLALFLGVSKGELRNQHIRISMAGHRTDLLQKED